MSSTQGLRVYDSAEFTQEFATELNPVPIKKISRTKRLSLKDKEASKERAAAFRAKVRRSMARTEKSKPKIDDDEMMVVLVDTPDRALRETIRDIVEHVPAIVEARQSKLSEEAIEALVSVYMRAPANAEVERMLYDSNAKARAQFLETWPVLSSKDVAAMAGHGSKNRSMTASRWKAKNKVFSIRHRSTDYFPAFQFEEGKPLEAIAKVLELLGRQKSGWQLAFWFTSHNGWLSGKRPVDLLKANDAIASAAAQEAEKIIG